MRSKLLSLEQVADNYLQIDVERVRQLVLSEELPSINYEYVRLRDLKEYMKNGGI